MLHGVISFHDEPTPICGLAQSSSPMPTARNMPRAAVFSRPSVTSRLRGLISGDVLVELVEPAGSEGAEGIGQVCLRGVRRPNHLEYPTGVSGTVDRMTSTLAWVAAAATALF